MLHAMSLLLLAFLPCSLNSDVEVATSRLRVELPPVTAYPPDGNIPAELKDRFVFLDEDSGDLVVSFSPDLNSENPELGQEIQETRITERVGLAISTCPSLSVVIQAAGDGQSRGYEYRYRLRDRGAGKQPITKWVMPLSGQEPIGSMVSPPGWGREESDIKPAVLEASAAWGDTYREELQRAMLRRRIRWWSQHSQWRVEPGNALEPFSFTTEARPVSSARIFKGLMALRLDQSCLRQLTINCGRLPLWRITVCRFQRSAQNSLPTPTRHPSPQTFWTASGS